MVGSGGAETGMAGSHAEFDSAESTEVHAVSQPAHLALPAPLAPPQATAW